MHVHARFFSGEEKEPVILVPKHGWAHTRSLKTTPSVPCALSIVNTRDAAGPMGGEAPTAGPEELGETRRAGGAVDSVKEGGNNP